MNIVLKDNGDIDALTVIKNNGFIDTTPDISLCTAKVFEKGGEKYRFVGWHRLNPAKRTWEDVEMELLQDNAGGL